MFSGLDFWNQEIKSGMVQEEAGGRKVMIYQGLPENLYEALKRTEEKYSKKTAIVDNWNHEYTYGELLIKTDVFANYLYENQKVRKKSHIGLMMYNCIEFCVAYLALLKLGAVAVPLPSKYSQGEVNSLAEKADIDGLICDSKFYDWFDNYRLKSIFRINVRDDGSGYGLAPYQTQGKILPLSEGRGEDEAIIMFTSGTTSKSKGAVIRNYNIMQAIASYQRVLRITENDITIIPVPIYHITGLVALLSLFIYTGGCLYLHRQFDAERVLRCVKENKITFIHSAPTVFIKLLAQREDFPSLPSLRLMACGSSNMPVEKIKELYSWLPECAFHTVYGLTETTSAGTAFPIGAAGSAFCGSSGRPMPGAEMAIWDEEGNEMPHDELGEVVIRGSFILENYLNLKTDLLTEDGWLHTGDIGYFNSEGYLYIVDRKKDMINHGGEKVPSFDVENAIYTLPQIQEAAVVGIKDEVYGEVVGAVVSLSPGAVITEDDIRQYLRTRLAKYKVPQKILLLDEVPKTPNNKIDKKAIRNLLNS